MPYDNQISLQISAADRKKMTEALQVLQETMKPYLIALTKDDRRTLAKMSDGTLPFVEKALDYAQSNPQFTPPYLNVPEFKIDFEAVSTLIGFLRPIEQLQHGLNDTTMLAGSEAYSAALTYYNAVKQAAKGNVPDAKAIYDDLSKRFEKSRGESSKNKSEAE